MLLMYVRRSYQPRSFDDVVEVLRRNPFGILVSASTSGLVASHLPFVYASAPGPHGTLYAHMARANEHATLLEGTAEAMVIFTGPHAYISPSWYDDRATAPTWDYVAVHCYGRARIHDLAATRENVERLIAVVEAEQPSPWTLAELERNDVERMLRNIVSFEIPLDRVEAKFKLNQGERTKRTRAAIHQLEQSGPRGLAAWMQKYNDDLLDPT
jgi:transcriptional regulator